MRPLRSVNERPPDVATKRALNTLMGPRTNRKRTRTWLGPSSATERPHALGRLCILPGAMRRVGCALEPTTSNLTAARVNPFPPLRTSPQSRTQNKKPPWSLLHLPHFSTHFSLFDYSICGLPPSNPSGDPGGEAARKKKPRQPSSYLRGKRWRASAPFLAPFDPNGTRRVAAAPRATGCAVVGSPGPRKSPPRRRSRDQRLALGWPASLEGPSAVVANADGRALPASFPRWKAPGFTGAPPFAPRYPSRRGPVARRARLLNAPRERCRRNVVAAHLRGSPKRCIDI